MDLLLGIDMGTGSTKGVLVDATGSVIASETIAAIGVGLVPPTTDWAKIAREIKPDPRNRGLYDDL